MPTPGRMLCRVLLPLLFAQAAHAEEAAPAPDHLSIELGAAAIAVPRYPGSDSLRTLALPDVSITLGRTLFASFATGIGARLVDDHGIALGVLARPDLGRRASDLAANLPGLSRISAAPELGGFAEFALGKSVTLRGEVRKAIGGHDGVVGDLSLSWVRPVGSRVVLIVAPSLRVADARFMRAYFGVPTGLSLTPWHAGAGLERAGVMGTALVRVGPRVGLALSLRYDRLLGDAADSPVSQGAHGSANQLGAFASLRYRL